MRRIAAIYRKEIQYYFQSATAYVVLGLFTLLSGYFFFSIFRYYNYLSYQASREPYLGASLNLIDGVMRPLLGNVAIVLLFTLPLLTMRLLAEERKQGTFELLLTYPVSDFEAIMGKYLAALTVFVVMLAGTLVGPVLMAVYAKPEPGPIVSGYLGLLLVGCTFMAIGVFFSSLTSSQVVAGVATFGVGLLMFVIGWASAFAGPTLSKVLSEFSLLEHLDSFSKGLINTQDITYYVFVTVFFLFLTLRSLESSHWRS
jgi:ABC-2 type transport system permease protein